MSDAASLKLSYQAQPELPKKLTLDVADDLIRLRFPAAPIWTYWLGILMPLLIGTFQAAGAIRMTQLVFNVGKIGGMPMTPELVALQWNVVWKVVVPMLASAAFLLACATYQFLHYRRFGRVAKTIEFSVREICVTQPGLWRPRYRTYPLASAVGLEVFEVKDLFRRKDVADFRIRMQSRRNLRFRVASRDTTLIELLESGVRCLLDRRKNERDGSELLRNDHSKPSG